MIFGFGNLLKQIEIPSYNCFPDIRMYQKRYQNYYYNFNTREGLKDNKLRYLIKTAIMKRNDIPIGLIQQNSKYKTPCRQAYDLYNLCLTGNMFDRKICQDNETKVIECQKQNGLFPSGESVIERLRTGLEIARKRRKQIERMLKEQHEGKSVKKQEQIQQQFHAEEPAPVVAEPGNIED